jgi:hypothetical protein
MLIIQRPEIEAGEAEGNVQSFTISPLEPGFGHTLGNSLRRTLLSSIPGAAVTQVRFDDALHEFDVIKGVKEDVTDVILNLKDLVLRCTADEAVTLRLDKRGPGDLAVIFHREDGGRRDDSRRMASDPDERRRRPVLGRQLQRHLPRLDGSARKKELHRLRYRQSPKSPQRAQHGDDGGTAIGVS